MANEILISDVTIKQRSAVHGNVDPQLIRADMLYAQDAYIKPALGEKLFATLLLGVKNNSLTVPQKYLIDNYIIDALMYYILSKLPITMGYQFWNTGLAKTAREGVETPSQTELESIAREYQQRAEFYKNGLIDYLRKNSNLYQDYNLSRTEKNAYTIPIYLGPDYHDETCCKYG